MSLSAMAPEVRDMMSDLCNHHDRLVDHGAKVQKNQPQSKNNSLTLSLRDIRILCENTQYSMPN